MDLSGSYLLNEMTLLRSSIQGRYFTENEYPTSSSFYVGTREKLLFGIGMTRTLAPHLEAGVDVKGFIKHDDERNYPQLLSAREYHGMSVSLNLTGSF